MLLVTKFRGCLAEAVPGHLQELLPAAVGLMLIFLGLMQGRLLVGAPIGMVMPGNLADPVAFYALTGIVLTLALLVWKKPFAIPLGMLLTAVFSLAEGFWVLPAAPFLLPEGLDKVALQLDLEKGLAMPDVILALLVFQILTVNGMRMALRQQPLGREAELLRDQQQKAFVRPGRRLADDLFDQLRAFAAAGSAEQKMK